MSDESEAGQARAVPGPAVPDDAVEAVAGDAGVDMVKSGSHPVADGAAESNDPAPERPVRESALVGAVPAGSARAAARRSGVRSGSTPVKGVATRPRDVGRDKRVGLLARLQRFLREVVAELRKVIWPARNQMITYTIVVIVFVVIMVALTAGLDVLFAKGVLTIFG